MSVMVLCGFFWKMPGKKWDGNLLQGLIVCQKKIGHEKDPKISSIRFGGKKFQLFQKPAAQNEMVWLIQVGVGRMAGTLGAI